MAHSEFALKKGYKLEADDLLLFCYLEEGQPVFSKEQIPGFLSEIKCPDEKGKSVTAAAGLYRNKRFVARAARLDDENIPTQEVLKRTISSAISSAEEEGLKELENILEGIVAMLKAKYPRAEIKLTIKEQYRNMRYYIEKAPEVVDNAMEAARRAGLEARLGIIRGGTDGSQLSYKGLPCPNIFAGGHNFHGKYEFVSLEAIQKATDVVVKIAELTAKKYQ